MSSLYNTKTAILNKVPNIHYKLLYEKSLSSLSDVV